MTATPSSTRTTVPHPIVWTILYFPFGAMSGFVLALTFLANGNGLSISEGAWLNAANLISQWLKWIWAPAVDVTLTPKRWYVIGTSLSALGVIAMASVPLSVEGLWLLLPIIALASLVNSIVGMSIEAMLAATSPPDEIGRSSAWFQAGNLGGSGLAMWIGLKALQGLPEHWMAGALLGSMFLACCGALTLVPAFDVHHHEKTATAAVRDVFADVGALVRTKGGLLAAVLCFMPLGTGAAQSVLAQEDVAAVWGAGEDAVALVQGLLAGGITAIGCFVGGWLCDQIRPRTAYALIGLLLGVIAVAMGMAPAWLVALGGIPDFPVAYVVGNLVYSFGVGLAYAAFTAVVLESMGAQSAATKYTIFASLSNFPIWWLGIVLGYTAEHFGPRNMLFAEAGIGVAAIVVFYAVDRVVKQTSLPLHVQDPI